MDMMKYFGIDVETQTLGEILKILVDRGVGVFSVVPRGENDKPLGMFVLLSNTDAIPYVQKALDDYDAEKEKVGEGVGG